MKKYLVFTLAALLSLSPLPALAQSQYPTSQDTAATLKNAVNNAQSTLNGAITNSATSIALNDASAFPSSGIVITIESEIIYCTGKSTNTLTGCTRGKEGTTAASHSNGRAVRAAITKGYHNDLRDAVIAVQGKLGTGTGTPTNGSMLIGNGTGTSAWSSTLPALDGSALTNLNASNIASGTVSQSRLPSSPTFSGTVTAGNFVGSGAGLTGITGATGGVANTGTTTIGADTDSSGGESIALQTQTTTRLSVSQTAVTATVPVLDAGGAAYNPQAHGAAGNGSTDDRAALNTLVNTTMSAGGVVEINKAYRIASNMTFPAGVYLRIHGAGRITPDNGVTVTILGGLPDEARQFFSNANASQGTIDLAGNVVITNVYPEWWGAKPSNSAANNNAPMQAAFIGAFGSNRTNGSGNYIYNRRLRFSGMYSISAAINFYHVHGAILEGVQQIGCGLKQTAVDTKILNGQSVTRVEFHQMRFEVSASQGNGLAAVDLDYDESQGEDLRIQNVRFKECFFVGNNLGNVGAWIAKTSGSQGDNVSFENCYASGWWAAAVLGGNNTGNLTGSSYNYNALNVVWDKGDIQSCKNGLIAYGGNWIVKNVTIENQMRQTFTGSSTPTTDGVDVYCEAAIRGCKLENVLSESYRIFAGDGDFIIRNVRQQGTPTHWYIAGTHDLAGTTPSVGAMVSGTGVGGDGKMYEVTAVSSAFGGLTYTQATGGSTTTIVKTSAGWTTNAFNGYRCSILTGTGKYLYGVITGNTSDTITVSSWLTKYHDITDTAPDNTSYFVVEPNWGTQTTVGGVTIAQRDYYTVTGLSTSTSATVDIDGLYLSHLGQVRAQGKMRDVQATRVDWFTPHSNVLDDTTVLQSYDNIVVREGNAGSTYKPLKWSPPRNRSGYDKYVSVMQLGTKSLVWSAGQTGGGTSFQDLVITRGDGIAYNDANATSRNVIGIQGTLGAITPVGTNQAGVSLNLQGGLSTGSGTPGSINLMTASAGSSGSSVNVGATRWTVNSSGHLLAGTDNSYDIGASGATRPRNVYIAGNLVVGGTCTGCGGGGGTTINSTDGVIPYRSNSTTFADSPLSRLASYSVAVSGNADTNGPNYTLTDTSGNANSRNWALIAGASAYGDFHIRRSSSSGGTASSGTSAMVINRTGQVAFGGLSPSMAFSAAGDGSDNANIFQIQTGTSNWRGITMDAGSGGGKIYTNYNGTGTEVALILGTYTNRNSQLTLNTNGSVAFGATGTATASAGAVTLNQQLGVITSESLTTAAGSAYTLTLTNSMIASTSRIFVSFSNGTNSQGTLALGEVTPSSGSATIVIRNIHASQALNGTIKVTFLVF